MNISSNNCFFFFEIFSMKKNNKFDERSFQCSWSMTIKATNAIQNPTTLIVQLLSRINCNCTLPQTLVLGRFFKMRHIMTLTVTASCTITVVLKSIIKWRRQSRMQLLKCIGCQGAAVSNVSNDKEAVSDQYQLRYKFRQAPNRIRRRFFCVFRFSIVSDKDTCWDIFFAPVS